MNSRAFAIFALLMVQVLYGLNYTFAKTIMNDNFIQPFALTLLRVGCSAVLFWLLYPLFPKEKVERKDYIKFFAAAVCGVAVNMLLFIKGVELTTPIHASAIITMSSLILKERITTLKIVGLVLAFSGALALTLFGESDRAADNILLGNTFIFINSIFYSIYIIIIKQLTEKYHPFTFIKWLFLFGFILVFPFGFGELQQVKWETFTSYAWFSLIFVVIGATFGTYLLNPMALSKLKASTVGVFIYLQPVIAGLFAIIMGADVVDTLKIIAMVLIFSGVYLVSRKPKKLN